MSKATYLARRGNIFYARIPLAITEQLTFNRREVWRSLRVSDYSSALEKLSSIMALYRTDKAAFMDNDYDIEYGQELAERYYMWRFNALLTDARAEIDRLAERHYDHNFGPSDVDEHGNLVFDAVDEENLFLPRIDTNAVLSTFHEGLLKAKEQAEHDLTYRNYKRIEPLTAPLLKLLKINASQLHKSSSFCEHVLKAEIKALDQHTEAYRNNATLQLHDRFITTLPTSGVQGNQGVGISAKNSLTFGELVVEYYSSGYYNKKTPRMRDKEKQLRYFLTLAIGEKTKLSDLKVKYVENHLVPALQHLPKHWKIIYRGHDIASIVKKEAESPTEHKKLSATTANDYLNQLAKIMGYATRSEYSPPSFDYRHLKFKHSLAPQHRRKSIDSEAINIFLSSPQFLENQGAFSQAHKYWVPIIALLTGMRMSEPLLMNLDAIKEENGIPYFDVTPNKNRSVKTTTSVRKLPINGVLLQLGFMDYVKEVKEKKASQNRLFPHYEITRKATPAGKYSHSFSRLLESIGIKEERISFHSTRHS